MCSYSKEDTTRVWSYAYATYIVIYLHTCIPLYEYTYILIYLFPKRNANKKQMMRLQDYGRSTWTIDDKRLKFRNVQKWTCIHACIHTFMYMHAFMHDCVHAFECMNELIFMHVIVIAGRRYSRMLIMHTCFIYSYTHILLLLYLNIIIHLYNHLKIGYQQNNKRLHFKIME